MTSSIVEHWNAIQQILFYLKVAIGCGILYRDHGHMNIECSSDVDWADQKKTKDRLLGIMGIVFLLKEILFRGRVGSKA